MPQPATLVEGKYEVLAKIREGGMGTIYKVRHRLLDEIRVIKVMRQSVATNEESRRRFLDEAKTATRLKHPNICAIHDFALDADGVAYLVMEYIDGVTLADLLKAQGSLKIPLCLEITHQTLLALGYLHRKKIVHRDIAPDNLMLSVDDEERSVVKLIDLGIAKVLDRDVDMTATGIFLGKLRYASPEQYGVLPAGATIDGRSDLYSMGLVFYELLTGKRPFLGETPSELMRAHAHGSPAPFEQADARNAVPEHIRQIVLKALQKNREDRFPSAEVFDRAVVAALERAGPRKAGQDEPTLISGVKAQGGFEGVTVTPSAEDRLNLQFSVQKTPSPSSQSLHGLVEQKRPESLPPKPPEGPPPDEALDREKRAEEAFQRAKSVGSVDAYRAFVAAYGASRLAATAKTLLAEQADFDGAASHDTESAWQGFLERWPSGAHAEAAAKRLDVASQREERDWQDASGKGTAAALQKFLQNFPSGRYFRQAERLLRELAEFDRAQMEGKLGYERFLREHPASRHAKPAQAKLRELEEAALLARIRQLEEALQDSELEKLLRIHPAATTAVGSAAAEALSRVRAEQERRRREQEQADWDRASAEGSDAAWDRFLEEHGASSRRDEGERRRAEARDLRQASDEDSHESWSSFLAKWPDGPHRDDALARVHEVNKRDEAAFNRALSVGSAEAYREFLAAHGASHLTSMAKSLLAEQADFDGVAAHDTEGAWRGFLERFPSGIRAADASKRMDMARQREDREWQAASREGTAPALLKFLQSFPSERYHRQAEGLLRELTDFDEAEKEGKSGYERFLREHPRSRRANAAQAKLRELEAAQRERRKEADRAAAPAAGPEIARTERPERPADDRPSARAATSDPTLVIPDPQRPPVPEQTVLQIISVPARKKSRALLLVPGVAAVLGVLWLWLAPRASSRAPQTQAPPAAAPVERARAGSETLPATETGDLTIGALPWGRVDRIEDSEGRAREAGLPQYTPLRLHLPPGKYSVSVSNPNYAGGLTIAVEVRAGLRKIEIGRFEVIDPATYFRSQGWGQ